MKEYVKPISQDIMKLLLQFNSQNGAKILTCLFKINLHNYLTEFKKLDLKNKTKMINNKSKILITYKSMSNL